jgi:hypothetical protein
MRDTKRKLTAAVRASGTAVRAGHTTRLAVPVRAHFRATLAMLLPRYSNMRSITLLVGLVQPWGDHFEGHFEGQNGVSERQPESGSARVS